MAKPPASAETKSFTIVLPADAAESLENLVKNSRGTYGSSRAQAAAMIILQHLQELWKAGKLPD